MSFNFDTGVWLRAFDGLLDGVSSLDTDDVFVIFLVIVFVTGGRRKGDYRADAQQQCYKQDKQSKIREERTRHDVSR